MLLQDVFEEVMCIKTCQCNDWHLTYLFIKCMSDLNDVLYFTIFMFSQFYGTHSQEKKPLVSTIVANKIINEK